MGRLHLTLLELSALADGELAPLESAAAREHLFQCLACSRSYDSMRALDQALRSAPAIDCESALPLISAQLDGELDEAERAFAGAHLQSCAACRKTTQALAFASTALAALPAGQPSPAVDHAIAALTRKDTGRSMRTALIGRSLIAVTAAIALVLTSLSRGAAPLTTALPASDDRVLVAAAQQIVLNPRTNTIYVLDTSAAAVDARDASTNDLKAHIDVGGRPTALALNESANTVLVLDASQKKVTEIDSVSNTVVTSTTVAMTGTPTGISVDPASNKILVTADAPSSAASSVAVINGATKQVESVRDFAVAPGQMVFSPSGDRAAVVSKDATTLVDSSYKPIATLPGGVGAAFAQGEDRIAILSASGSESVVTYVGGHSAPIPLHLQGAPRAIVSLPDGGFLVLVALGDRSRVSSIAPDGHEIGNVDLAIAGRDLIYDPSSRRFSVASAGQSVWADVPQAAAALASPTAPSSAPSASPSVAPSASPSVAPSASPSTAPSATPSAAPSGTTASPTPKPLDLAAVVTQNFVHLDLPDGRVPYVVSQSGERLWVVDDRNAIDVVDLGTGEIATLTSLPRSAQVTQFIAGRDRVYAIDARRGDLYVFTISTGYLTSSNMALLKPVSSVTVGLDDRLWIGMSDASLLLRFDPQTRSTSSFDLQGAHVSRLTTDGLGRIFYADDARNAVGSLNPANGNISEFAFPRHGVTTALVVDGSSTLWLGTSAGEIWSVRGGTATVKVGLQRPVTLLTLDASGRAWYLAPVSAGAIGFGYATADGTRAGQTVAGPAFSLAFSALGNAWLPDPRGGFWVSRSGN